MSLRALKAIEDSDIIVGYNKYIDMRYLLLLSFVGIALMGFGQEPTKTAASSKEAKIVDEINLSDADIEVFKEQTKQKVIMMTKVPNAESLLSFDTG